MTMGKAKSPLNKEETPNFKYETEFILASKQDCVFTECDVNFEIKNLGDKKRIVKIQIN